MDYYNKYVKYKTKYLELKYDNNQYGGGIVPCDKGYTNVLGTCWMSSLLGLFCFGDLTSKIVYDKMNSFYNPSIEEIKKNVEQFIKEQITQIQLPIAFINFQIFEKNLELVKIILHKFIERYYNKVMNIQFTDKPENTDPLINPERCERKIATTFLILFPTPNIKTDASSFGSYIYHNYLFCNLLSIFFLDYKVSFRNYYNNFSSIEFDDKNDLGILIYINGHVCCLYMCDGRPKFYNDNNKTVYDCEWKDLLKTSNATNLLYVKDGCLIIINDITAYVGDSKIYKVVSLTVISKYETKYTDLDNDITTFLKFSDIETIKDLDIETIKDLDILTLIGDSYVQYKNFDKAKEMYKLAADQGYLDAQYNLALMLYNGYDGNKNFEQARQLFTLAANQGDIDAQYMLGHMLYEGEGGNNDLNKARQMSTLAAKNGHVKAQYKLGLMLYKDPESDTDLNEARQMFTLAANKGHVEAQYILGWMLYDGKGGNKNIEEARRMFKLAANQGLASAQYQLGLMLYEGDGGYKNVDEARQLFTLAANQGNLNAQYDLAMMLYYGDGGKRDYDGARQMFTLAANQGNVTAAQMLKILVNNKYI